MNRNDEQRRRARAFLAFAAAMIMMVSAAGRARGEEANPAQVRGALSAVEQAPFTREAKATLRAKLDAALKSGVPAEDAAIILTRSVGRGLASHDIEALLDIATKTRERKLPERPVLDRIEQGLSKGASGDAIVRVARKLSERLDEARTLVNRIMPQGREGARGGNRDEAVEAVARAYEHSIPEKAVARSGAELNAREHPASFALLARAVDAMTEFVASGMTSEQASRLVSGAISRGYAEKDFAVMERSLAEEMKKGRSMNDIVSGMESRMESGSMRESPERPEGRQMMREPGGPERGPGMGGPRR